MFGEKSERFHINEKELQFTLVSLIGGDFINLDLVREIQENPNI